MRKFKAALVQLDSQNNKMENLENICAAIDEAAAAGASLVCFPENMNLVGKNIGQGGNAEAIPGLSSGLLSEKAKEHGIYIHGGTIRETIPDEKRYYNTTVFIGPDGSILAKYRKIHTFDVTLPDGTVVNESARIHPGDEIVTVETELGTFGFSICYDIRFPELYRLMALKGAQIIFTPASFTMPTGKDHWEVILRTRAIENGVYILAPGQIGKKEQYDAYGNSMVVDPWGMVVARAGNRPTIIYADIDLDYEDEIRRQIPSLANRRADVYVLNNKK